MEEIKWKKKKRKESQGKQQPQLLLVPQVSFEVIKGVICDQVLLIPDLISEPQKLPCIFQFLLWSNTQFQYILFF